MNLQGTAYQCLLQSHASNEKPLPPSRMDLWGGLLPASAAASPEVALAQPLPAARGQGAGGSPEGV